MSKSEVTLLRQTHEYLIFLQKSLNPFNQIRVRGRLPGEHKNRAQQQPRQQTQSCRSYFSASGVFPFTDVMRKIAPGRTSCLYPFSQIVKLLIH